MIFPVLSVVVPLIIYVALPQLIKAGRAWKWLLLVACFTFFVSWYLPSPLIYGDQTEFVTHFVGGGVFTGLLWLYITLVIGWQAQWYIEVASLFALVSALGVANELFELLLLVTGYMPQGINDTSWDLLANTLGAAAVYVVYALTRRVRAQNADRPVS